MRRRSWTIVAATLALATSVAACRPLNASSTRPVCAGSITVTRDEPTPCDVRRPAELNVLGLTQWECDDAGGQFDPATRLCVDVDY